MPPTLMSTLNPESAFPECPHKDPETDLCVTEVPPWAPNVYEDSAEVSWEWGQPELVGTEGVIVFMPAGEEPNETKAIESMRFMIVNGQPTKATIGVEPGDYYAYVGHDGSNHPEYCCISWSEPAFFRRLEPPTPEIVPATPDAFTTALGLSLLIAGATLHTTRRRPRRLRPRPLP